MTAITTKYECTQDDFTIYSEDLMSRAEALYRNYISDITVEDIKEEPDIVWEHLTFDLRRIVEGNRLIEVNENKWHLEDWRNVPDEIKLALYYGLERLKIDKTDDVIIELMEKISGVVFKKPKRRCVVSYAH
jgi:hypothetical protein